MDSMTANTHEARSRDSSRWSAIVDDETRANHGRGLHRASAVRFPQSARVAADRQNIRASRGLVRRTLDVLSTADLRFLHSRSDVWHIFLNMVVLWIFGRDIEHKYGAKAFLEFILQQSSLQAPAGP